MPASESTSAKSRFFGKHEQAHAYSSIPDDLLARIAHLECIASVSPGSTLPNHPVSSSDLSCLSRSLASGSDPGPFT